jgi:NAD(P)-dependent dehydrogenase (short-subunit alcohol dehydrogenase family)
MEPAAYNDLGGCEGRIVKKFADQSAVITGAASGLGRGLALALAARGTRVVAADQDRSGVERTAEEVRALGVKALAVHADVSDPASVLALADRAYEAFGSVQLLVNNAAVVTQRAPLWETPAQDWRWMLSINVEGVAHGLNAFVPRMLRQPGERHVVITSSTNGLWIMPGQGAYNTSKYALIGLSEALADDLAPYGMKVSVVCPGPMNTEMGFRSRPPSRGGAPAMAEMPRFKELDEMLETWGILEPKEAGSLVLRGIEDEEFYILTHKAGWEKIAERHQRLREAFERRAKWD